MKYFAGSKKCLPRNGLSIAKKKNKLPQISSCADCRGIIKEFINLEALDFSFPIG